MSKLTLDPICSIMGKVYQTNWLVENFIEQQSLCMLFGEPSTYKSFMAMELAFCIGSGIDWYGNPVTKGDVIYIAGEGFSGIQKRFQALAIKYRSPPPNRIYVSSKPLEMTNPESVNEFLNIISQQKIKPALIVIDTLHRNFGEGDENSSRDVGLFVKHIDKLKNATNATILTIHHSGHGEKGHSRGSSAIRASLDSEYQLKAKSGGVELICKKMKDFDKPDVMEFVLKPIQVKTASGTLDSAYLELAELDKPAKQTRAQQLLQALNDATADHGIPVTNALLQAQPNLSGKQCVPVQEWRQASYSLMATELPKQPSRQAAFNRCRNTLIQDGFVIEENGYAVLV
jgi:hypothetical protein